MIVEVMYSGRRLHEPGMPPDTASGTLVMVDNYGTPLDPSHSQRIRNHSPDGFNWGYGGSGPAQLALALLLDATNGDRELAERHYQRFKEEFVAGWGDEWTIRRSTILDWISKQTTEL